MATYQPPAISTANSAAFGKGESIEVLDKLQLLRRLLSSPPKQTHGILKTNLITMQDDLGFEGIPRGMSSDCYLEREIKVISGLCEEFQRAPEFYRFDEEVETYTGRVINLMKEIKDARISLPRDRREGTYW